MSEVFDLIPGGKTALGKLLEANFKNEEVQAFLKEVEEKYRTDESFKSELESAGFKEADLTDKSTTPVVDLSGLTEQEKARVLNAIDGASSSDVSRYAGANSGLPVGPTRPASKDNTKWYIALGVAAVAAIVMFRGVVFRTLYFLACKLPVIGAALKAKFGEPKEIMSGKMSDKTRRVLIEEIKELGDLLGVSGYRDGQANLARLLRLLRKLNPEDVQEVMDAAKDYKLIG